MNLVQGEITEIYISSGTTLGKVTVGGSFVRIPLFLLMDVRVGDRVLIDAGVAISKIDHQLEKELSHVLSHTGQSA